MTKKKTHTLLVATAAATAILFTPIGEGQTASAASATTILDHAKSLKGVKYRYGGTTTKGFDCSGFVQYVFKKASVQLPRTTSAMYRVGQAVSKGVLKAGDLVFFKTSGHSAVSHVGIYIGGNQFIHSSSSKGVSIAAMNDSYWGKRYVGAKRVAR